MINGKSEEAIIVAEKIIGVITKTESDLSRILEANIRTRAIIPEDISKYDLNAFFSLVILGGCDEQPIMFRPRDRVFIEKFISSGRRVFCEYCGSIGNIYFSNPESTRFERLAFCLDNGDLGALKLGDLLDDQCNTRIKPYEVQIRKKIPILQYVRARAHNRVKVDDEMLGEVLNKALWIEEPGNLMICNFRMANFVKARFSPANKWRSLVKYILEWVCEEEINADILEVPYHFKAYDPTIPFEKQVEECIDNSISWFRNAEMLINNGRDGVKEGLATEIYPDGKQRVLSHVRDDCFLIISCYQ
jgi:hypothetical protein